MMEASAAEAALQLTVDSPTTVSESGASLLRPLARCEGRSDPQSVQDAAQKKREHPRGGQSPATTLAPAPNAICT